MLHSSDVFDPFYMDTSDILTFETYARMSTSDVLMF